MVTAAMAIQRESATRNQRLGQSGRSEVVDEETRKKILAVGRVLIVNFGKKKERDTALVLQPLGG